MTDKLDAGDVFPAMSLNMVGGDTVTVPDDLRSNYAILLFYRGHW